MDNISELLKTYYHLTNSATYFVRLGNEESINSYPPNHLEASKEFRKKLLKTLIAEFKNRHDTTVELSIKEHRILLAYSFVDSNAFIVSGPFTTNEELSSSTIIFCTKEQLEAYKVVMSSLFKNVIGVSSTAKENLDSNKELEQVFAQKKYYILSYELENRFFEHFLNGEEISIKFLRELDIFNRPPVGCGNALRVIKNRLICAVTVVSHRVIEAGVNSEDSFLYSDYFINKIEEIEEMSEANQVLYDIYDTYLSLLKKSRQYNYSPIVERAIKYVKENITKEISLNDIAKILNVHPNYLSTIFNRETGSSLTHFITTLRMEEAKKMLAYTDQSILDIALSLGFNSQSYFTTVFKKYTSMNPKKYRKRYRKV
ncbi:AraC family transcriptional regulator [Bacillaceae bacterium S4-13-58]